jgi:hypothetical protein
MVTTVNSSSYVCVLIDGAGACSALGLRKVAIQAEARG